jgi:hypothetical protein
MYTGIFLVPGHDRFSSIGKPEVPPDLQELDIRRVRVRAVLEKIPDLLGEDLVGQKAPSRGTRVIPDLPLLREPDLLLARPSRNV